MTPAHEVLKTALRDACDSLFPTQELSETGPGAQADPGEEVAIIGFNGEGIWGILGVSISPALLRDSWPLGEVPDQDQYRDWHGEICNQMLGIVKAKLLPYDVVLNLAVPFQLGGVSVQLHPQHDNFVALKQEGPLGSARFWIDAHIPETLEDPEEDDEQGLEGGDFLFF